MFHFFSFSSFGFWTMNMFSSGKSFKSHLILHPFLLSVFPVFSLYSSNISQLDISVVFVPSFVCLLLSTCLFFLLFVLLKNAEKAGLIVSTFVFLFFSFGHAQPYVIFIFFLWPSLFVFISLFLITTNFNLTHLSRVLNAMSISLILFSLFSIGGNSYHKVRFDTPVENAGAPIESFSVPTDSFPLPNIYLIVVDAYARNDILSQVYDFDNSNFTDFLTRSGFFVANLSSSNYSKTDLSLPTLLNMDYIENLVEPGTLNPDSKFGPADSLFLDNRVFRLLKTVGYTTISFSSGYPSTELKSADIYFDLDFFLSGFQNELINTTPLPVLFRLFASTDQFDLY